MESFPPAPLMCSCKYSDGKVLSEWGYPGGVMRWGGGLISITTIDRGRVVGVFTHFSRSVCVGLVFSGVGVSA